VDTPNKYTSKIATTLCMVVLFLPADTMLANPLPTEELINNLAENAKLTADTFMQQSFKLRMQYEYSGKFLTADDKENLHNLAKSTGDKLQTIVKEQETLKQQIEDYKGDDWENKYGSTGLWRKSAEDLFRTTFYKCEIDFYLALASEQPQRNEILHKILAQIDSMFSHALSNAVKLLKIKTLILLAETEPEYRTEAKNALYSLDMIYPDTPCEFDIRRQIQKIKFSDKISPDQVNKLTDYFFKIDCTDDFELILSLAILQLQSKQFEAFEKTASLWPQTKDFIGSLILSDLSHRIEQQQSLQQISIFEAELATQAAWKNETKNHKKLLSCLSNTEEFQTPLILYVTATTLTKSSPAEAVNLLVKASELQQQQKSDRLNIESCKIAEQAAQLAYNLFIADSLNCPLALQAFENYYTMAGGKIDEELEYLYTVILNNCSQDTKAKEVLEKIADRPAGNWRNRARLDLILQAIQKAGDTQEQKSEILKKLRDFILSCHGQDENNNELRMEAMTIYCQSLLESKDKISAEKVLEISTKAETTRGINLDLFKAQALQQLGRLDESAHYMLLAIQDDSGSLAPIVLELLAEVVEKIDEFETKPDNPYSLQIMENCKKLAQFCYSTLNDRQSGLFLAEISVFAADKNRENLLEADKLLNNLAADAQDEDVDLLRCRARLLCEQAEFDEAARLWAKIARIQKNKLPEANQQSWKWWRAKFYELYCWSKCPQTKTEQVLHTIEVLENSFSNIPPLWTEKLNSLKHLCRSNFSTGK
jgi:hypothetical protein